MAAIKSGFQSILRPPDVVRAFDGQNNNIRLDKQSEGWVGKSIHIWCEVQTEAAALYLTSAGTVSRVQFRWLGDFSSVRLYLGDAWERSYADLQWQGEAPNRVMPWYFLANDGVRTHGYGVRTHPNAMCFWTADSEGISLWADVRSGGMPVNLGDRKLAIAEVVCREGIEGETPFRAARQFCKQVCRNPRLPAAPVYGTNDWNYAYGNSSAELIATVSGLISELSPDAINRPFSVVDEGWAMGPYQNKFGQGPWVGNPKFGDMGMFAQRLKGLGVRPGIWYRPLTSLPELPANWSTGRHDGILDPTIPEVRAHIATVIQTFVGWGYELVKHDYTTRDLFGKWGFQMGASPTRDGWRFNDNSLTNAEVAKALYECLRTAAGEASLLGCNTLSHMATGFHEVQRTGDDTSGRSWDRNRRMGVNTLAFRACQQGAFYQVDPDMVTVASAIPWDLEEQWLRLVSRSGTSLFVALQPTAVRDSHKRALKQALALAATKQPVAEPLDWLDTECPRKWRLIGREQEFNWMGPDGAWPFED